MFGGFASLLSAAILGGGASVGGITLPPPPPPVATITLPSAGRVYTGNPGYASLARPMTLDVAENGGARARGTVDAVGSGAFSLKTWGGDWVVNIGSAQFAPYGASLSTLKVGDAVVVDGLVATSSSWTINADHVADLTYPASSTPTYYPPAPPPYPRPGPTNGSWSGSASNIDAYHSDFTLTGNGNAYTVSVASTTGLYDRNYVPLGGLSTIVTGDTVRAYGSLSGLDLSALYVVDASIPR